nr:ATP-dependent DNA helicase PIF1-like [Tanacetum cinerariifolium]
MSTNARRPTYDIKTNHIIPNEVVDVSSEVEILSNMPVTKNVVERKQDKPDKGSDKMWDVSVVIGRYLSTDFVVSDAKDFDGIESSDNKYLIDVAGYVTNVGRTNHLKSGSRNLDFHLANHMLLFFADIPLIPYGRDKEGMELPFMWERHLYRLEVDVSDNTVQAVVVMFNETATALVNCSADSLMDVGNKMHKVFPLLVRKFPLPEGTSHCLKKNATARRKVMPLPEDCTAVIISKKLSVKDDGFLKISAHVPPYILAVTVIEFKDSYKAPENNPSTTTTSTTTTSTTSGDKSRRTVTLTTEDMQKKKNDVKARTTLLLSLPDEHQLQFSKHKTAKELWAAILKTFGGNEATKKTKKNLLKQQYGNFKAEGSETLEQTFTRLQVIIGQLQNDLDTMSLDDLYNHLKVYEAEVQKKSEPNTQNMAFISSTKHSRGNDEVNTASVYTASSNVPTASANVATDINQINEDDMEEMDIKWNMDKEGMKLPFMWERHLYRLEVDVSDNTAQAVVVLFNETATALVNCSVDSLMDTVDEDPSIVTPSKPVKERKKPRMDIKDSETEDSSDSANAIVKKGVLEPSGGTGKTLLYKTIIARLRSEQMIMLVVASSGIASLLLPASRTSHSRIVIPLELMENNTCARRNRIFRGMMVLLGRDFRQILPVIPNAKRPEVIQAFINQSELWKYCKVFTLTCSMHINEYACNGEIDNQKQDFNRWVLAVSDGKLPAKKIVMETYPDFTSRQSDDEYLT